MVDEPRGEGAKAARTELFSARSDQRVQTMATMLSHLPPTQPPVESVGMAPVISSRSTLWNVVAEVNSRVLQ
jgi:hypothetical protein